MRYWKLFGNQKLFIKGMLKELIATREIESGKYLVVVYRELNKKDGFIVTAFLTRKGRQLERRTKLWPQ